MTVNFMVNSSPEIYVNKTVSISKQVDCNLKGEVDILHPTLIVKDVTIGSCNYMQIPDFNNRYYYIDSVITRNNGILEISGRVDVLMSHKTEILALGGIVSRQEVLYNAELKAGILPIERHNHSKSISYVQKGLDATLATGSKNLRFKNSYKYPIYIHAYTYGGQITVEFWSNKSVLDGKKYIPVSFVKGSVANTYLYGYNSKGELIYKKFI